MEQDKREVPTIREIESQIWKIAQSNSQSATQLEACRDLLKRAASRERSRDERELSEKVREIESQIWKIAQSNSQSATQLEACRDLIERIEAREVKVREAMNQGRGDDELPTPEVFRTR